MELAFTPMENLMAMMEQMMRRVFKEVKGQDLGPDPFLRLTYAEAMERCVHSPSNACAQLDSVF